ncbi:MAG: hypothetical protein H7Y59_17535 [Anaerolineales bacterium]|nr:hypothetical protein [Anaerolineales bacterium]
MKQKFLLVISILIIATLSACGGSAEPTMSADDISNTAIANAWVSITQTQAAMPTNTPVPPTLTFTPQPTFTFVPTQPILPTLTPAAVVAATQGECDQPPPAQPLGELINVEFENHSEGIVNLAFGMNSPNAKKECVTYSYVLGKASNTAAKILGGCYWGYGWITGDKPSVARSGSVILCMKDPNVTYHIEITKESINFK